MNSSKINNTRIKKLNDAKHENGKVIYWMNREQRVNDNWGLLAAQNFALKRGESLLVIFYLNLQNSEATIRQYDFMLKGLMEVEESLSKKNIPFLLLTGSLKKEISKLLTKKKPSAIFTDFYPLKQIISSQVDIASSIKFPFYMVDSHNIVPCWLASDKLEFSARTIRKKIRSKLELYLTDFPKLKKMESANFIFQRTDWNKIYKKLEIERSVEPIDWLKPGESEAKKELQNFIINKLDRYALDRNDPTVDGQSNLSPYLHFGQISSQRIALEVLNSNRNNDSENSFLEELIIRKELSDNYCYYNKDYDNFDGYHSWAQKTLGEHFNDKRDFLYTQEEFEKFKTHDQLWNAAQNELVLTGKIHGFMRMYWAKKILEWSINPIEAHSIALYLNDKYSIDGCDPNGYVGVAWSIGGVHDRAWSERNVYGKIRYMNYNGCKRKFDVLNYIKKNSGDLK